MKENNKTVKKTKSNGFVKVIGLGMALLIISGGAIYMFNLNDEAGDELIKDKTLGNKLDDTGWMLFVQAGCPACAIQKDIMGSEISGLKVVDCAASEDEYKLCLENNITMIPTWHNVFSNETIENVQDFTQLEEMAK